MSSPPPFLFFSFFSLFFFFFFQCGKLPHRCQCSGSEYVLILSFLTLNDGLLYLPPIKNNTDSCLKPHHVPITSAARGRRIQCKFGQGLYNNNMQENVSPASTAVSLSTGGRRKASIQLYNYHPPFSGHSDALPSCGAYATTDLIPSLSPPPSTFMRLDA